MMQSEVKSPSGMDWLDEIQKKYGAITPEQKAIAEKKHEEHCKQQKAKDYGIQISQLRSAWDAPARHLALQEPKRTNEWGTKLTLLESKIGTGFTVALVGVRGNGKTQIAVQLMIAVTEKLKSAKFCTAAKFFMAIKASYRKDSDNTEFEVLREYRRPALLVIDEIGKRSDSGWENTLLFELLNDRYNDMTDTVLIDNRPKSDFVAAIGASLASRMSESGGIIECNWESFR